MRFDFFRFCRVLLLGLLLAIPVAQAQQSFVRGTLATEAKRGFGRIILTFPSPVTADMRVAGGVLILRFDQPVDLPLSGLSVALPDYIAGARIDPDRRSIRLALTRALKPDLKDAAERLYLDLVPEEWRGAPPALPPDVSAQLAARVRAVARGQPPAATPESAALVTVALARSDSMTRITFAMPKGATAQAETKDGRVTIRFDGNLALDRSQIASELGIHFDGLRFDAGLAQLHFAMPAGRQMRVLKTDGGYALDFVDERAAGAGQLPPVPPQTVAAPPTEEPPKPSPQRSEARALESVGKLMQKQDAAQSGQSLSPVEGPVFDAAQFDQDRQGLVRERGLELLRHVTEARSAERIPARMRLAAFYLANYAGTEAKGVLGVIAMDTPTVAGTRRYMLMKALAEFIDGDMAAAELILSERALGTDPEAAVLRAMLNAENGRLDAAHDSFGRLGLTLDAMPDNLLALIRPKVIEAALSVGDVASAKAQLVAYEQIADNLREPGRTALLKGQVAEKDRSYELAAAHFEEAQRHGVRPVEAEARLARVTLAERQGSMDAAAIQAEIETIAMIWRRGPVEIAAQMRLAQLATTAGRWRDAFSALRRALEIGPNVPAVRSLQDSLSEAFEALFLKPEAPDLSKIEAIAIFDEFRSLVPPGQRGDVMVRKLAERLLDLDLVPQATELLSYQVRERLKGAEREAVGLQLAGLLLGEGRAQDALDILRRTRRANPEPAVRAERIRLEARAVADLGQVSLAEEMLAGAMDSNSQRALADVYWRAKRFAEAGEALERALAAAPVSTDKPAGGEAAGDILRAAIGYALAGDGIGVQRLNESYGRQLTSKEDTALLAAIVRAVPLPGAGSKNDGQQQALTSLIEAYRGRFGVKSMPPPTAAQN